MSANPIAGAPPLVIFGAGGFVGEHLRHAAQAWPGEVVLVGRRSYEMRPGSRVVQGDLACPGEIIPRLPKDGVVINLAYDAHAAPDVNLALADGLLAVCAGMHARRLVHVSTAMVVGRARGGWVTERTACLPVTSYQRTKLAIEVRLRERTPASCPVIVLRPTAVFGRSGLNLRKLVADLTTRPRYENYLRACLFGARPMNLVPAETVAAAILFAVQAPVPDDGLYLVADDETPQNNFQDIERTMRRALKAADYPVPIVPMPAAVLAAALRATGRLSFDPRTRFSSARIRQAGFDPPVTFADALARFGAEARSARAPGAPT